MRATFHAVLHHQTARNGIGTGNCAECGGGPCRYHSGGEWRGEGRKVRDHAAEGGKMSAKILIVDDEANTLASLSRAFRLAGHEAVVCDNATRALELAQTQSFDLILSDVVMPKRDGLALLEDLKNAGV